jgi:isopentenyl-diphosphate Delta-isomerase
VQHPPEKHAPEKVVLLDDQRRPAGTADKATVHTGDTPLHLAFSCYVRDASGRLLVTRRALGKRTWPGVWSNSLCGHPRPGEDVAAAVVRRAHEELGVRLTDVRLVLPDFAYRAADASGVVENEVCPVFAARTGDEPEPDPTEVCEWRWADWADVAEAARRAPWALSPWSVLQIEALSRAPDDGGLHT